MAQSKSDFSNMANSGRSCVGCGRDVTQVKLKRIRSYGRALACGACLLKHRACANLSPITEGVCNHEPHAGRVCGNCGCVEYRHGLESEADRQLAACVGLPQRSKICESYGTKLGKCGRLIFADSHGGLGRLCDKCQLEWIQQNMEQDREMAMLLDDGQEEKTAH